MKIAYAKRGGKRFDALPERYQVTETSYYEILAERVLWTIIQTLPANLREPWSKTRETS